MGKALTLDAGANDPEKDSNNSPRCLPGLEGSLHRTQPGVPRRATGAWRTCKLVQNCVAGAEGNMVLTRNNTKGVVRAAGRGVQGLACAAGCRTS